MQHDDDPRVEHSQYDSPSATALENQPVPTYTPGPWRVTLHGGFVNGAPSASVWIEAGEYTSIASLIPHAEIEANARLIAAAPDLLAALKGLAFAYGYMPKNGSRPKGDGLWSRVYDVVLKAEGR